LLPVRRYRTGCSTALTSQGAARASIHAPARPRRAARKFSDVELEENSPGLILSAIDFRVPVK
jgi:hypothetical protein